MSRGLKGLAVLLAASVARGPLRGRSGDLGDMVDAWLGRKSSRYTRHYRRHLLTAGRRADFGNLSIVDGRAVELDAVFVDVAVAAAQDTGGPEEVTPVEGGARQSVHDFLDHGRAAVLAVIGGPGQGKTTLLRQLARDAVRRESGRRRIPVPLELSRLSTSVGDMPGLPRLLRLNPPRLRVPEPKGWWERQLHGGNCLILMDGLDEVADEADRRRIADWIGEQINAFPGNDFVITSRPGGYPPAVLPGARVLAMQPFGRTQSERFLRRWYPAAERNAADIDDSAAGPSATERADDLIDRLEDAPELDELTANPLLLTMIAVLHRRRGDLPRDRTGLYEAVCRQMLWNREAVGGLSGEAKWEALAQLAFQLMRARRRSIDSAEVPPLIADILAARLPGTDCERFLREMRGDGLLVELERGRYAFAHHTIGEYLAARNIIDRGLQDEISGFVDDSWWAATIELYGQLTDDLDELVETCLGNGTEGAMVQAFSCAGESGRLGARLRDRLLLLEQRAMSPQPDPRVARAVSRARISRHLSGLNRLGDSVFYCPRPLTADQHRLYRHATDTAPAEAHFGDGNRPVSGLWPEEVTSFVGWINTTGHRDDGAASPFRLPNREESELIRANGGAAHGSVWRTSARGPELPFTLSERNLLGAVTRDVSVTGLLRSAIYALLMDLATTMKRGSAPAVPGSGARLRDRARAATDAADIDGIRALVAQFSENPDPPMGPGCGGHGDTAPHHDDDAPTARLRKALMEGIGRVYSATRPKLLGWLPPTAAVFTKNRGEHARDTAVALAHGTTGASHQDAEPERLLAELILDRVGLRGPNSLSVVLGSTSRVNRNPDIALRESVAAPGRWHESVSRDLAEKVRRILTRQDPLRSPSVLRLSGLIAAAEFEAERNQLNRDACLNIVTLVTFLEQRTGADYPGEALFLVRG